MMAMSDEPRDDACAATLAIANPPRELDPNATQRAYELIAMCSESVGVCVCVRVRARLCARVLDAVMGCSTHLAHSSAT